MIVRFVDISLIYYHQCSNFLFIRIKTINLSMPRRKVHYIYISYLYKHETFLHKKTYFVGFDKHNKNINMHYTNNLRWYHTLQVKFDLLVYFIFYFFGSVFKYIHCNKYQNFSKFQPTDSKL